MPENDCNPKSEVANPLLSDINYVHTQIKILKEKIKKHYFKVVLSLHECPECRSKLVMTGVSRCSCISGHTFDPTRAFQKSTCCNTHLIRKTFHYVCSRCKKVNPSRFLFDEKLFDREYFKEMMKASRAKAQKKREEMIKFFKEEKSDELPILEELCLESIPGLLKDLDRFICVDEAADDVSLYEADSVFEMQDYRNHILSALDCGSRFFSNISHLGTDPRVDRVWRFVTLTFMQHEQEVELIQYDNDLLIERIKG